MIPKTIHYCWFGGKPLPPLAQKCITSWQKFCPDYKIKRWDESNFDIHMNRYVKEAYQAKKYAFVTDFVRLWALVKFGGIYMDTDVEVLKSLDTILQYQAVSGFEDEKNIPTGLMGCEARFPLFEEFLKQYENLPFMLDDKTYDTTTNVSRITESCVKYGLQRDNTLQTIRGFTLFPKEYFCPKSYVTGEITITPNTFTIHHFAGSWAKKSFLWTLCILINRYIGNRYATILEKYWYKSKFYIQNRRKDK